MGALGCRPNNPNPVDQLPRATQTGANTFGCLVNGHPWTPQGNNGRSNSIYYNPIYRKGALNIGTYWYAGTGVNDVQYITLASDSLKTIGEYQLTITGHQEALFVDGRTNCLFLGGALTLTRLDLVAGVISGTFRFTLYKPGCDSVRVIQGRFDKKL